MPDDGERATWVTSHDVARKAGVSRSAVSRAFTPGASISTETRKKVVAAASELGYRINLVARGLNKQRTDLVGMIVSGMRNPFRSQQVDALAKRLIREGFRPMLFCLDEEMDTGQLLSILLNYQVSGVVITSDAPPVEICEECARMQVPLALVGRGNVLPFVDHINGDDSGGGRLAADALIEAGCRRLFVLKPENLVYSVSARISAFVARAAECGIDTESLALRSHGYENGREAAAELCARRDQGLGIFCPTDVCAIGLLDALRIEYGIKIPEEMCLIGYDDIPQAGWLSASLTTIKQPVDAFARVTVDVLKRRIENPKAGPRNEIVDVSLVRRGTVL